MKVLIVLIALASLVAGKIVDPNAPLPSSLKICRLNDPQRDSCIKESMQQFLPTLKKKTESFAFSPIDPFTYDLITFDFQNTNRFNGVSKIRNIKNYGMSRGKVRNVKSDFSKDGSKMDLQLDMAFPKIFSTGKYVSNMTASSFRLNSKGVFNISLTGVNSKWNIKGVLVTRDGEQYMNITRFNLSAVPTDLKLSVSGLFADRTLNQIANEFFNQNWRNYSDQIVTASRKQWEPLFLEMLNKFFSMYPFRRLLLTD